MNSIFKIPLPAWRVTLWIVALIALFSPWMLMRVAGTGEWTASDFIVFGLMLTAACGGLEIAMCVSTLRSYRLAAIMTIGGGFLMVWANLAVGIIGNEKNPQNLIFYSVLLIGLAGALITRFDPRGLTWTLRTMAGAQVLIFIIAAALDWALLPVFTAFYFALWLVAGELFNKSAQPRTIK